MEYFDYDFDGNTIVEYKQSFSPLFFHPNLMMMDIPGRTPEEVREALEASFALFFADPNAAGNALRISIEHLLKKLKVKKYTTANGKRKSIPLHNRIAHHIPPKYENIKAPLEAIKWIGNHGSHSGNTISSDSVLEAYDLMELVIEDLYSNKRERLKKLAKSVNQRKGPRGTWT